MKEIRLSKVVRYKSSTANLLNIYKHLNGKENLEKRLFLKTLIWASINPNQINKWKYAKPHQFFTSKFTIDDLNRFFNIHKAIGGVRLFGHKTNEIFGNIF